MKCPGQDSRYWEPGAIFEADCPHCGRPVEFFKDESSRRCRGCGAKVLNPRMDFGCAAYCRYAEQCLGELSPALAAQRENLLKDRVAVEMKRTFKQDFRRIGRAVRVARFAERIALEEKGDPAVVLSAAYLHDIGGSEEKTPSLAREILAGLGARADLTQAVVEIVGRVHRPGETESINLKCVRDAILLVGLEEIVKEDPSDASCERVVQDLLTGAGRRFARDMTTGGRSGDDAGPPVNEAGNG